MKKSIFIFIFILVFNIGCDNSEPDPEISVIITYDQLFTLMNYLPFWGWTYIDYTIGNIGEVDITTYSIIIECINTQSETRSFEVEGLNLNIGDNHEGEYDLHIIGDPASQVTDCYLKSQTLDGTTTDFN